MLCHLWPSHLPGPLISSFHYDALAAARARAPDLARGILFRAVPKHWRAVAESGPINIGEAVRITAVDGLTLKVVKAS